LAKGTELYKQFLYILFCLNMIAFAQFSLEPIKTLAEINFCYWPVS